MYNGRMTNETVKAEWRAAFDEYCDGAAVAVVCENCGEESADMLAGSGFLCEQCADSAIAYGRLHVPEAYED